MQYTESKFLGRYTLEPCPSGTWFRTFTSFGFFWKETGETYIVDPEYLTDGASTPRALWWFMPPISGRHGWCAVLHDWVCENEGKYGLNRKQCDQMFYDTMKYAGVNWFKRWSAYTVVRIADKIGYRDNVLAKKKLPTDC